MSVLRRLRARLWLLRHSGDSLARRVKVETYLIRAAKGQRPLPDAQKCMELAQTLGIPYREVTK